MIRCQIRGIGMGMSLAMFWGSGTLSNQFLLTLIEGISFGGALMIAALSGVIVLVFVALFVSGALSLRCTSHR